MVCCLAQQEVCLTDYSLGRLRESMTAASMVYYLALQKVAEKGFHLATLTDNHWAHPMDHN